MQEIDGAAHQLAPAHAKPAPAAKCTSFFLDALPPWMAASLAAGGAVEGKLLCECGAKFGSFDWAGTQCSCGAWVTPAIQVPMSKVDSRSIS